MHKFEPMGWADCFTPEALIEEIFHHLPDLTFPIPIFEIAKACGITAIIDIATLAGTDPEKLSPAFPEGFILLDTGKHKDDAFIYYKDHAIAPYRKRFTVAHELAHYLLPHHVKSHAYSDLVSETSENKTVCLKNKEKEKEKEANRFASGLLLPVHLLEKELDGKDLSIELIKEISHKSCFSFGPLINRCVSLLKDRALVAVHSKDGLCRQIWISDSETLPGKMICEEGSILPEHSKIGSQSTTHEEYVTVMAKLELSTWFNLTNDEKYVYEQTYYQQNGYAITLLIIQ